jgi:simple sugar transport system substrate-binding protein
MVTHSGDGDTFWDIVQSGAEQAAAELEEYTERGTR